MINSTPSYTAECDQPQVAAEFQSAMQSLLATLADIDIAHEVELERVNSSALDEAFKLRLAAKLVQHHREQRQPYLQEVVQLQNRMRLTVSRVPIGGDSQR